MLLKVEKLEWFVPDISVYKQFYTDRLHPGSVCNRSELF